MKNGSAHEIFCRTRRLHRLLPSRDVEEPGSALRAGAHPTSHPGEVRHLANARRAAADHRRTLPDPAPTYSTATGAPAPVGPTQAAFAGTTDTQNPRLSRRPRCLLVGAL